jgi:ribonuclease J
VSVTITPYGGVGEIGGNKILVETAKTRIWLDFGLSFSQLGDYFSEFLGPRRVNGLGDFFEMGLLPRLKGLYRSDFLKRVSRTEEKLAFDGVFLSHPHVDHAGMIPLLHKDLPVYCGETAKLILQYIDDLGSGHDSEYLELKEYFTGASPAKTPRYTRNVKTFRTGDTITFNHGDVTVEPVHVDHSVPGAYGFIIRAAGKVIAYTGDLRMHGPMAEMTHEFIRKAAAAEPDVLITEGTNIRAEADDEFKERLGEAEVREKLLKLFKEAKGLVVTNFPMKDVDRFITFYEAAKEAGRKLVITLKQAYMLQLLLQDPKLKKKLPKVDDKHLIIYVKRTRDGKIVERGKLSWDEIEKEYVPAIIRPLLQLPNARHYLDLKDRQHELVLYCDDFSLTELIDLKPVDGSIYVYSLVQPFNEEMRIDKERVKNWMTHFGLEWKTAHASGHLFEPEMRELIKRINPRTVIPIHTEAPGKFREFGKPVILPEMGRPIGV